MGREAGNLTSRSIVARHFNGILGARAANVSIKKCFILIYSRLEKLREITVERRVEPNAKEGGMEVKGVSNV